MTTLAEWKLTSEDGKVDCSLPYTMVFLGRTDCDINMESDSVDKRHALITFDHYQNRFKVKDLGTSSGTYINERRIPDETFITIEEGDAIQLGRDILSISCLILIDHIVFLVPFRVPF
ncbi:centrosomal protein of 170 kDa protein B-like [Watersipora subatra]|uniref:centrosomal protein of 170 kDa protein B-like n=1 Tax=Watersipora subatra TaxID=2589382 RepID=UPI00355C4721